MLQTEIINNKTTLFVSDSGGYFTICRPTNFHKFYTRKTLAAGEHPEDFIEVTATEKAKLKEVDAAWVEPPRLFIEQWNEAAGAYGRYNPETGFFELNGIIDLTYTEALEIYRLSAHLGCVGNGDPVLYKYPCRTAFPLLMINYNSTASLAANASNLEVVVIKQSPIPYISMVETFANCSKLRKIEGAFSCNGQGRATFQNCAALEEVRASRCGHDISFAQSPKLSLESLKFLVSQKIVTTATTVTVHPDVFSKITGDTSNEAAAALSAEELQQWMELIELAASKNVSFTTN